VSRLRVAGFLLRDAAGHRAFVIGDDEAAAVARFTEWFGRPPNARWMDWEHPHDVITAADSTRAPADPFTDLLDVAKEVAFLFPNNDDTIGGQLGRKARAALARTKRGRGK
jgi:hypothetical protein